MSLADSSIRAVSGNRPSMVEGVGGNVRAMQRGPFLPGGGLKSATSALMGFRSRVLFSDKAYKISGTTKDSNGNALGNCTVDLFYTVDDAKAATVESDSSGLFSFSIGPNAACYIVAYKSGAPDVAGTTVSTLVGS